MYCIGNVYIADGNNNRLRKITVSTGIITTIAGTGAGSYSGDNGAATSATIKFPCGVALDSSGINYIVSSFPRLLFLFLCSVGNVYISDNNNHRIRKVTVSTGIISTFAGTGSAGYSGNGVEATSALLYYPAGLTFDLSGIAHIISYLRMGT